MTFEQFLQQAEGPDLEAKEYDFLIALIDKCNGNGVEAARMAGYNGSDRSLAQIAWEIKKRTNVSFYLIKWRSYFLDDNELISRLNIQSQANLGNFYSKGPDGEYFFDIKRGLELGIMAQLQQLELHPDGTLKKAVVHNPNDATKTLCKITGVFLDDRIKKAMLQAWIAALPPDERDNIIGSMYDDDTAKALPPVIEGQHAKEI